MNLSRRSVGTGLAAAVAAIPTIAIARPDPIARIKHHTAELERAMREAYGVEVDVLSYEKTKDCSHSLINPRRCARGRRP